MECCWPGSMDSEAGNMLMQCIIYVQSSSETSLDSLVKIKLPSHQILHDSTSLMHEGSALQGNALATAFRTSKAEFGLISIVINLNSCLENEGLCLVLNFKFTF